MSDDGMPTAPMAAIPAMSADQSGANDSDSNLDDLFFEAPSKQEQQQQPQMDLSNLSDQDLSAMLVANCATPPPFDTINPSALNSPTSMSDTSSSPFETDFHLFADDHAIDTLSAGLPRQAYNPHHAFTDPDPHPSPASSSTTTTPALPFDFLTPPPPQHHHQHQHHHLAHHNHLRAHSQPPEDVGPPHHLHHRLRAPIPMPIQQHQQQNQPIFHRQSGHYLGSPRHPPHPFPPAAAPPAFSRPGGVRIGTPLEGQPGPQRAHQQPQQQQQQQQQHGRSRSGGSGGAGGGSRQHPYKRAPTSAPQEKVQQQQQRGRGGSPPPPPPAADQWRMQQGQQQQQPESSLLLGVRGYVERVRRECEGLEGFVARQQLQLLQQRRGEEVDGGLERRRMEKRSRNLDVTELDEPLEPLPRRVRVEGSTGGEEVPWDVPACGRVVRGLGHEAVAALLEAYDIPFQPDMFLGQKKEMYLRFVGASRALMHRVLD